MRPEPLYRSLLFAPGNHSRRVQKAMSLDADVVILDLEDACPVAEKTATRAVVVEALRQPRRAQGYVRINALSTEFGYGDLCAVVQSHVDGIMLTKVGGPDSIKIADWLISQLEGELGSRHRAADRSGVDRHTGRRRLRALRALGTHLIAQRTLDAAARIEARNGR